MQVQYEVIISETLSKLCAQSYEKLAGNFRENKFLRIPNKHARKKNYFLDKVTMSDHTSHNFSHETGDTQRVFQRRNDSKTLPRLLKRVGRCRRKTALPNGGN